MGQKWRTIPLERELAESAPFRQLSGTAIRIYLAFLTKRQVIKRRVPKKEDFYETTNNGEIVFTYKEAENKHGIKEGTFRENRDRLVELGFIDIAQSGAGIYKCKTLYAISERWRKYGTPDFLAKPRRAAPRSAESL